MSQPTYKRPTLPNLETQRASTEKLRAQLDRHAAHEGISLHRPVPARELAGTIRQNNERRAQRAELEGDLALARNELHDSGTQLLARLEELGADEPHPLQDAMTIYIAGALEFFHVLGTSGSTRDGALQSLRESRRQVAEAIASIDRMRKGAAR
jgi:hypothetical protein